MKKIIILSYYFPPGNMTASERIFSWAKYLHQYQIYPVIITRNWETEVKNSADLFRSSGNKIKHEKHEGYEVFYIPYKSSFKEQIFLRVNGTGFYFVYLVLAFLYAVKENITCFGSSLFPLYAFAKKILHEQKDFSTVLISGNPFELFHFGYKLSKKYRVKWIADYRDDWTTNELHLSSNFFKRIIQKISRANEIKWVSSASYFFSVSDHYVKKIAQILPQIKHSTLPNGYIDENYALPAQRNTYAIFTIIYTGSLYSHQPIQIFLEAFKKAIDKDIRINLKFIGIKGEPESVAKVLDICKGYEKHIEFTLRVPKQEAIAIQMRGHVLLATSYLNLIGIPGSKLYEYIALRMPVILCPSDHDIIEQTLLSTGQVYIANDTESCFLLLENLYTSFLKTNQVPVPQLNESAILGYSRKEQVKILARVIHELN